MKFHQFCALGGKHTVCIHVFRPEMAESCVTGCQNHKNQRFHWKSIIPEKVENLWNFINSLISMISASKTCPRPLFFQGLEPRAKMKYFLRFLDIFTKKYFSIMKKWINQKKYENHVSRESFTPSRDGKKWKIKNSWKLAIFLKIS